MNTPAVHRLAVLYSAGMLNLTCPDNDVQKQYLESGRVSEYIKKCFDQLSLMLPARHSYTRMRTPFCVVLISKNIMHPFAPQHLEKLGAKEPRQHQWCQLVGEFRGTPLHVIRH